MIALILYCLVYYLLAGIATALGYHRCLTHSSFKLKKWFEHLIILVGLPAGTPIQWVANHRYHHIHADKALDPHSPIVDGFWYAHNGWYINSKNPVLCFLYAMAGPLRFLIDAWIRPITNQEHIHLAKDIAKDPFYQKISKPWIFRFILLCHFVIPFGFAYFMWGGVGIIALWITLVLIYNIGDGVNSLGHEDGPSEYGEHNKANNRKLWALITFGDAYHADHHEFPTIARLGVQSNGLDLGWKIILLWKHMGLASDLKVLENNIIKKL